MPAESATSHRRTVKRGRSTVLAVVLLLLTGLVTARLGLWQLDRAAQKRELAHALESGREQAPLALGPHTTSAQLTPWRPAWVQGVWLLDTTVLVDNRSHEGRPGYWVVTALCVLSPDAPRLDFDPRFEAVACERAVAVLRGWVPRPRPSASVAEQPEIPEPPLYDTVEGELLTHVPERFELSVITGDELPPLDFSQAGVPVVQNLHLDDYARATGLSLLPMVLQQTGDNADGLSRQWEGPPVNIDTHRGYALQWFSFAAIAWIAMGVLLVKAIIRRRRGR